MAVDVSKMNASDLDKLSAKIEKRRQELARQEALAQMEAVAKKHGVDFAEIVRLHNAKLPKMPKKVTRKAAPKASVKAATKSKRKVALQAVSKSAADAASKPVAKTTPKLAAKSKVVSKAKYKNPNNPKQTWSGMGRKPAWFIAHLEAGKKPEGLAA